MSTWKLTLGLLSALTLSGCQVFPYQAPLEQGNVIEQHQQAALHTGMFKEEVLDLLGEPLLHKTDSNIWHYTHTKKLQGKQTEIHTLTLKFKGEQLQSFTESRYKEHRLPSKAKKPKT